MCLPLIDLTQLLLICILLKAAFVIFPQHCGRWRLAFPRLLPSVFRQFLHRTFFFRSYLPPFMSSFKPRHSLFSVSVMKPAVLWYCTEEMHENLGKQFAWTVNTPQHTLRKTTCEVLFLAVKSHGCVRWFPAEQPLAGGGAGSDQCGPLCWGLDWLGCFEGQY